MSPFSCNLQLREDIVNFTSESFGYDVAANRLTSSQVGANTATVYIYDDIGNIMMKSDAGNYTYDPTKIHAVTGVAGNQGTIPSFNQDITYTSFSKVESITENGHILEFTYGHDRLRRKTEKYFYSALFQTKYYLGNYEKVINELTGEVTEFHYISAPSGMFAVFTKATGQPDKLQYIHTDHLGSVQFITNENGTIDSQHSFNAWGRSRNPLDWSDYTTTSLPAFNRGFTGHEHLTDFGFLNTNFGLINMNGRLYDPVLGRMLSPDNYVQSPSNSQNYNRYSYVMNNPLKYTDPSGESILGFGGDFSIGFVDGFLFKEGTGRNRIENGFHQGWHEVVNGMRIDGGLLLTDPNKKFWGRSWELVSRFTWQAPQTIVGYIAAHGTNLFTHVNWVKYKYGTTVLQVDGDFGGFTLSNYIVGDKNIEADESNSLFQHEYGHYIQSQVFGPYYLQLVAMPSSMHKKSTILRPHGLHPIEQDANVRAFMYFSDKTENFNWVDKYGIQQSKWNFHKHKIINYNRSFPYDSTYNQNVLQNNKQGLTWADYLFGPTLIIPGIINIIYFNGKY